MSDFPYNKVRRSTPLIDPSQLYTVHPIYITENQDFDMICRPDGTVERVVHNPKMSKIELETYIKELTALLPPEFRSIVSTNDHEKEEKKID